MPVRAKSGAEAGESMALFFTVPLLNLTVALGGLVVPMRLYYFAVILAVAASALLLLWRAPLRERLRLAG